MRKQPPVLVVSTRTTRRPWARRVGGARRQHGAVMMLAAIWLGIAIAALGAVDVGNVYFVRRELQRTADLAAMAAVQMVSTPGGCTSAASAAKLNATANGFTASEDNSSFLDTTCGRWDTSTSTYFSTSGNPLNAVQVQMGRQVPFLFVGPARDVTATATALASNIDSFSLGTGIASINTQQSALLNAILGGLLNAKVSLSVGDVQSLAAAQIKLDDLRVALNAATMKQLLGASVSTHDLTVAMANALTAGGDTVSAGILNTLALAVPGGQNIAVGDGVSSAPGLLAVGLANPESAATATINALDALLVAAQIAQSPQVNADGSTTQPPAINVAAKLKGVLGVSLQIVNPPVLAVGEGGMKADGTPRTQAHAASINLSVSLPALLKHPVSILGLVNISALSTPIVLTLAVAPATASLDSIDCESSRGATRASMTVTPGVALLCLGGNSNCSQDPVSHTVSAPSAINVISVTTLLNVPLTNIQLNGLGVQATPKPTTLVFDGSSGSFDVTQSVNSNDVGTDLSTLTTGLLTAVGTKGTLTLTVLGADLLGTVSDVLSAVTSAVAKLLQPVFDTLDAVIVPVLSLLGVQLGTATVHNMSLTCGVPQLVK